MAADPTIAESIERMRRRADNALLRALSLLVVDLVAITHRQHPDDYQQLLRSSRLELQTLRQRRRRPTAGETAMWATVVGLLELAPGQAQAVHGDGGR